MEKYIGLVVDYIPLKEVVVRWRLAPPLPDQVNARMCNFPIPSLCASAGEGRDSSVSRPTGVRDRVGERCGDGDSRLKCDGGIFRCCDAFISLVVSLEVIAEIIF